MEGLRAEQSQEFADDPHYRALREERADAEKWRALFADDHFVTRVSGTLVESLARRKSQPVRFEVRDVEGRDREVQFVLHTAFNTTGHNALVETRYGPMLCNRNDIYVGGSLLKYGEFSHGESWLFEKVVHPGATVVCAGANIGVHAVRLAQLCFPGICHAFEPQRFVYETLVANGALNSLLNLTTYKAAVTQNDGTIRMLVPVLDPTARQNFGGLELQSKDLMGESKRPDTMEWVKTITIDSLELPALDFLMADVEGMERDVLLGAEDTINRFLPMLYLEADRADKRVALFELLEEWDYAAYWHSPPLFNPDNFAGDPENIFGEIVSMNWLCVPANRTMNPTWQRVTKESCQ